MVVFFCPHKRECWSDANQGKGLRAFKYEKGPNVSYTSFKRTKSRRNIRMVNNHWVWYKSGKPFVPDEDKFGFVYIIN